MKELFLCLFVLVVIWQVCYLFKVDKNLNEIKNDLDNHVEIRKLRIRKGDRKGN